MPCLTKSVLRWGLIAGLALGGATLVLGPQRMMAGLDQVKVRAVSVVDDFVEDPVALRRQLQELADQYPERIAEVHGELAEVSRQIEQLENDSDVAQRVVANTTDDLRQLRGMLAEAESHAARGVPVSIRSNGVRLDVEGAKAEARRISETRTSFQDRAASNGQQLIFLHEQQDRLSEILKSLQGEFDTFETKLTQIDRQIDAIERNERLIEMTREQKQILRSYEKFGKVGNLSQLESKLAQLQAIQTAQLESLSKSGIRHDYEREAREELAGEVGGTDPFDGIELDSETFLLDEPQAAAEVESTSTDLAFADPIVIEPKRR